ncbi:Imm1 family immunity protein [Allokutzneria sp. NRRL B-24872]|uniref:Imm1 family immunity protein n=1 Tax=Allokutzneria sp. NRRL B-24872 TaxID=1137961 RepID=UPI000A37B83C|nr:Imm1 family immunity protein [Allokutzneria sp. NRRL B-24872]
MVELNAYYDFEHGDNPERITSAEQLDAVLSAVLATRPAEIVQLLAADNPGAGLLDVGLDHRRGVGVLYYSGPSHRTGCFSHASTATVAADDPVLYYFMNADTEYPPSAEIPAELAISAAQEYMRTGQRPTSVDWQPARPDS